MKLTEHFTAEEIRWSSIPLNLRPNALATLALLERVRATLGVPLRPTSLYRSAAYNDSLAGASATSQHVDATAVDFQPIGLPYADVVPKVLADMRLRQSFGQFIAYRSGSHFHVSLPTRGKIGEVLQQVSPEPGAPSYSLIAAALPPNPIQAATPRAGWLVVGALLAAGILAE